MNTWEEKEEEEEEEEKEEEKEEEISLTNVNYISDIL